MNCEKAQEYVSAYINHSMPKREQEAFIEHVTTCSDCFGELETYFIVDIAIKYLDEEKEESYNITKLLEEDLKRRLARIKTKRYIIRGLVLVAVIVGVLAALSLIYLGYIII